MKIVKIDNLEYELILESYGDESYAAILRRDGKIYLYHREGIAYSVMEIK